MVLEFTQPISAQAAKVLRTAIAKNKKFANLKDYAFLYKDFVDFLKKTNEKFNENHELPVFVELGKRVFSRYGMTNDEGRLKYVVSEKTTAWKDLSFGFGPGTLTEGLHFFINDIREGEDVFTTLEIFNDWMAVKDFYECEVDGLLLDIGAFFNNKLSLYRKIYRALVDNRKKCSKFLGKAFYDDFILLFSLSTELLRPPKIKISKQKLKETSLAPRSRQKTWEKIGSCDFCTYGQGKGIVPWCYSSIELELWLDKQNQLILTIAPIVDKARDKETSYCLDNMKKEVFEEFARKNLNDWVNQYVAAIDFTEQLYNVVKTKIFISNI